MSARALLGVTRRVVPRDTAAAGFFAPLAPPEWVLEEVERIAAGFPSECQAWIGGGLRDLLSYNLESGGVLATEPYHAAAAETARQLAERRDAEGVV